MTYRSRLLVRNFDWILMTALLGILAMAFFTLYSAGKTTGGEGVYHARQLIWTVIGLGALAAAVFLPYRTLDTLSIPLYGSMIALLLYLLFAPAGGADRWISVGPIAVQPSEASKIALVLILARVLADRKPEMSLLRWITLPVLLAAVPFLLVLKQPDLGTALVFGAILVPMLFWAGLPARIIVLAVSPVIGMLAASNLLTWVLFLVVLFLLLVLSRASAVFLFLALGVNMLVGIAAPVLWNGLHDYQKNRILTFLDPSHDPLGAGYQIIQSAVAIGSGGFWGKGYLEGTQKGLSFLPEQHTDFIFSVVGEEFGFVGCSVLLLLYTVLLGRMLLIALRAQNRFASLMVVGFFSYLSFQVMINVGMTIGLVPVTGLPLPLVSYGGSSLSTTLFAVGAVLGVGLRRNQY
ncbi:MAG: rod shape-determining protein RodA [Gemmatimonadetes bacterium]|nr:rod shape-determining protein RodA [Gemmatimonadota bacterium]